MPFQSEKQRRYLWANEPEIARDWTDTYGSGIAKALGGRIGYADAGEVTDDFSATHGLLGEDPEFSRKVDAEVIRRENEYYLKGQEPPLGLGDRIRIEMWKEHKQQSDDQTRLSNEDYLNQMDERQMTANLPYLKDFKYDTNKFTNPIQDLDFNIPFLEETYADQALPYSELDDLEANNYGQGIIKALPQQNKGNWLRTIANFLPFVGKDTKSGMALRALRSRFMPKGGIGDFAQTMRGGLTQRGYEQARQNRINMQRQSNIIKTLQSKNYAPGWEQNAFQKVQDLGKDLNLVDAADVGLTKTRKKIRAPVYHPNIHAGEGGQGTGSPGGGAQAAGDLAGGSAYSSPFNRGGLAGLWQR